MLLLRRGGRGEDESFTANQSLMAITSSEEGASLDCCSIICFDRSTSLKCPHIHNNFDNNKIYPSLLDPAPNSPNPLLMLECHRECSSLPPSSHPRSIPRRRSPRKHLPTYHLSPSITCPVDQEMWQRTNNLTHQQGGRKEKKKKAKERYQKALKQKTQL